MARLKRWLARTFAVAVLAGVGVLAFHIAKYTPRCVISSDRHLLHFSDDGRTIITGYTGVYIGPVQVMGNCAPPLRVWDTHSGAVVREAMAGHEAAKHIVFAPDRRWSMADLGGGRLCLVDWQTGEESIIRVGHEIAISGFQFSPCSQWFYVYAPESKQPHELIDVHGRTVAARLDAHANAPAEFSRDGDRLYIRTARGLKAWGTRQRKFVGEIDGGRVLAFDPSGKRAAVQAGDRTLAIWDTETFRPIAKIDDIKTNVWNLNVAFSPSGKRLALSPRGGFEDLSAYFWDVDTGQLINQVPVGEAGWGFFTDERHFEFREDKSWKLIEVDEATCVTMPGEPGRAFHVTAGLVVSANAAGAWDFVNPATGEVEHRLPLPIEIGSLRVAIMNDRGVLCSFGRCTTALPKWLEPWVSRGFGSTEGVVQVLDPAARRVEFQMRIGPRDAALVSRDASTLLVYDVPSQLGGGLPVGPLPAAAATPQYRFRFYDLQSHRPWLWATATPAGILVVWLLWRTWRRRHATPPAQTPGPAASRNKNDSMAKDASFSNTSQPTCRLRRSCLLRACVMQP
jgi:hypothetical protein